MTPPSTREQCRAPGQDDPQRSLRHSFALYIAQALGKQHALVPSQAVS